jgi:membrane protein implicated in regulation of membrane protease activity
MVESWWVWVAGGLVLAILEVALPGYIFVGFALGMISTGLLLWSGQWPAAWLAADIANALAFAAGLSVVIWLGLRMTLGVRKGQSKTFDRDINED